MNVFSEALMVVITTIMDTLIMFSIPIAFILLVFYITTNKGYKND